MQLRHNPRLMGASVKIDIIPDEENEDRPDLAVVVAFAGFVVVQKPHEGVCIEELPGRFAQESVLYDIVIFFLT